MRLTLYYLPSLYEYVHNGASSDNRRRAEMIIAATAIVSYIQINVQIHIYVTGEEKIVARPGLTCEHSAN